jgi:hypothetical protein
MVKRKYASGPKTTDKPETKECGRGAPVIQHAAQPEPFQSSLPQVGAELPLARIGGVEPGVPLERAEILGAERARVAAGRGSVVDLLIIGIGGRER